MEPFTTAWYLVLLGVFVAFVVVVIISIGIMTSETEDDEPLFLVGYLLLFSFGAILGWGVAGGLLAMFEHFILHMV